MGGSPVRMKNNAEFLKTELSEFLTEEEKNSELENLTQKVDRYVLYKVGPVLVASVSIQILTKWITADNNPYHQYNNQHKKF